MHGDIAGGAALGGGAHEDEAVSLAHLCHDFVCPDVWNNGRSGRGLEDMPQGAAVRDNEVAGATVVVAVLLAVALYRGAGAE